jgi:hypothetical protein
MYKGIKKRNRTVKMQFEKQIKKILEDFNILPYNQNADNLGPDLGMTTGNIQNTFPSRQQALKIKLPKKIKRKKKE